jgi:hypothetical protein
MPPLSDCQRSYFFCNVSIKNVGATIGRPLNAVKLVSYITNIKAIFVDMSLK